MGRRPIGDKAMTPAERQRRRRERQRRLAAEVPVDPFESFEANEEGIRQSLGIARHREIHPTPTSTRNARQRERRRHLAMLRRIRQAEADGMLVTRSVTSTVRRMLKQFHEATPLERLMFLEELDRIEVEAARKLSKATPSI